ncbi:MAG: glycerate kinase [Bacteroidaceae bacterium]|nr:glycerate kinase [Bacteroidaceae bacterium]
MKHILIATDSFKGSLTSLEVAEAICSAIRSNSPSVPTKVLGISDGGEGFAETVTHAMGGELIKTDGHDALMRPIRTHYGVINGNCGVMDVASTIGLTLLTPAERNPLITSSYGVGEMIHLIIHEGIRKMIIGLGGSSTNDCGRGMLEALKETPHLDDCEFIIASDVSSPLCGPKGATYLFARQKGATEAMLPQLEARNLAFGKELEQKTGKSIIDQPGSGAAGGIGAALMTMKHYKTVQGIDWLLDLYNFKTLLKDTSLVITGEGKIDRQTLQGKAPYGIALMAKEMGVPCIAICGKVEEEVEGVMPWDKIIQVSPPDQPLVEAMRPEIARRNIEKAISSLFLLK